MKYPIYVIYQEGKFTLIRLFSKPTSKYGVLVYTKSSNYRSAIKYLKEAQHCIRVNNTQYPKHGRHYKYIFCKS